MELRTIALAGALSGLVMLAAATAAPAMTPALLAPSLTPTPPPAPKGPRIYKLPYGGGQSFDVCQGNNHAGGTHTGLAAYAWDFCMPIGTPVGAARSGTVKAVRQSSNSGGWGVKYADDANYVVVDHGDGTSGLYMHLAFNGARVKVGDQVQTGQLLAYSGNTGWTSAPHLHFMVMQAAADDYYTQSVPVLFQDVPDNGGLPLEDNTYTSGNAPLNSRYTPASGPPAFTPFWVETFRGSSLWSGSDDKAVKFGPTAPWQFFQVVAPQSGPRLEAIASTTGAAAFIPAADVGPSGPPPASTATDKPERPSVGAAAPASAAATPPPSEPTETPSTPFRPPDLPSGQVAVAAGDTLFGIAKAHALSIDKLISLNGLSDPNALTVGQVLKIG
ncbi:MAG: peptidoglycan DD-metalloendopeptidase family protein [Chloroflexota bacterium]